MSDWRKEPMNMMALNLNNPFQPIPYKEFCKECSRKQKPKFEMVRGKQWLWVYKGQDIYLDGDGKGMNGQSIELELVDGNRVTLEGPWMSNPKSFEEDTGIRL